MQIQRNISLKPYNTFGIDVKAKHFVEVHSPEELQEVLSSEQFKNEPKLVLGGGSNILLVKDVDGLVIKNSLKGIEKIKEDENHVWIKAGAGEVWHDLVMYCVERNYGGIENLSLIPGSVGAAPMQNIGAYGVEIKEVFDRLEAMDIKTGAVTTFTNEECSFGYRDSIFKNKAKGKYIIISVTLKLSKKPEFNVSYGAIQSTLEEMGVEELSIKCISDAVCHIRSTKLPDPAEIGNSGSFFKNPELERGQFEQLQKEYPDMPHYPLPDGKIKVPAAWLIEQCGWKGKRVGRTGSHKNQALVLVNYGGATGKEVKELAMQIQQSVKDKFGIELQPEVNFVE